MLLAIDIGNTNMVLGVFEGDTIVSKSASGTKVRCRHWCGQIRPIPSRTPARLAARVMLRSSASARK